MTDEQDLSLNPEDGATMRKCTTCKQPVKGHEGPTGKNCIHLTEDTQDTADNDADGAVRGESATGSVSSSPPNIGDPNGDTQRKPRRYASKSGRYTESSRQTGT